MDRKHEYKKWLLLLSCLLPITGFCEIIIHSYHQITTISATKDEYDSHVVAEGKCYSSSEVFRVVNFNEFTEITNLSVEIRIEGGPWRKLKKKDIELSDNPTRSFFYNSKSYRIHIARNTEFRYSYDLHCSESMLMSEALLFSELIRKCDYQFVVPPNKSLEIYVPSYIDEGHFIHDTISISPGVSTTLHLATGQISEKERNYYNEMSLHLLVHPRYVDPFTFFTRWLHPWNNTAGRVDLLTKNICDSLIAGKETDLEKANCIFRFVQEKIRYTAIELGNGAWIPRPPNYVCKTRRGDCKDMANLLKVMLGYAGIEADYAVLMCSDRPPIEIFPSLSAYNHAICIATIDQKNYVLDATDPYVPFDLPSRHTQGRPYLIVSKSPTIVTVPLISAYQNKRTTVCELEILTNGSIQGQCKTEFEGLAEVDMREIVEDYDAFDRQTYLDKWYAHQNESVITTNKMLSGQFPNINASCGLSGDRSFLTTDVQRHYLSLDFLPHPDGLHLRFENLPYSTYFTQSDHYLIHLKLPAAYELESSPLGNETKDAFQFHYAVSQVSPNELKIVYSNSMNTLYLTWENYENYNHISSFANSFLGSFIELTP